MATVNVGNHRSQCFTVNVMHSGDSEVNINLQNDLIPGDAKDWLCGIQSLSAPLDSTRFLDETKTELFRLLRIQHGKAFTPQTTLLRGTLPIPGGEFDAPVQADFQAWNHDTCVLRHDRTPCLEFGDLLQQMTDWVGRINELINIVGLNRGVHGGVDHDLFNTTWLTTRAGVTAEMAQFRHLKVRIGASGMLSIIGSNLFWANFVVETSNYMQALTNLPRYIGYNVNTGQPMGGIIPVDVAGLVDYATPVGGPGVFPSESQVSYSLVNIVGDRSLWGSCDTRLSISVATDLPLQRSLTITDSRQCRDFTLGSFDLNNEVRISQEIRDSVTSTFTVDSQSRAGHSALKKSGPPHYWIPMRPATHIRNLRLRLMIRERRWDEGVDQWRIVHKALPIEKHQTWQCVLIFAKKTH
jgi:hypothetical protein